MVGRGTPEALSLPDIRDSKASCLTPPPLPDTEHTFTAYDTAPVFISVRVCATLTERGNCAATHLKRQAVQTECPLHRGQEPRVLNLLGASVPGRSPVCPFLQGFAYS